MNFPANILKQVGNYKNNEPKKEMLFWSEEEFLGQRTIYAQNENIEFEPTYILFAYNGESCPLKLSCKYLEVFWDSSFVACTHRMMLRS